MSEPDKLGIKVGEFVLSDSFSGVGVILSIPDDCTSDKLLKFVKIKFPDINVKFFTVESAIRARQRFLDATKI